ncbi:protein translocase subunit SecF [Corynebacterium sanguinis]|uniref:Protein translocase subunit SecF n=1 Tax=Corynebacterium sanguinis TaxID=2594913 RepID=A0A6C1TZJ8_9CORY|nr:MULTISPECIES: protein translocase subunit SecF [Corynebacterium]MBA4504068.1 protein translocase subunit SecF [Corynebacterium sanguinis]MCT1413543.1 protein translocase subunit SecF [Corynebacterium sanguinis]MCT1426373.1 protein translocase subunit SecF [Corynebacterium sanguinis]MCT1463481.1 protein translocase subunit SecF [Corynebacterium sanguinis]MCT1498231.1 protein translocase subunit SecF [Corynebacterium sanguinis]
MGSSKLTFQSPAENSAAAGVTRSRYDRLYTGEGAIDFIGRSKLWYGITLALVVVALAAMLVRGFNLGIDFEGGTKLSMPAGDLVAEEVETTFIDATGVTPELTQIVGAGDARTLEINSEHLTQQQIDQARQAIFEQHQPLDAEGNASPDAIGDSTVSESWGSTITNRMLLAMGVFLLAAAAYVALRLKREMAVAAMAALLVDGVLILGTYALFGLEITPAMIIGLLTVLTFSIYDTVIVFDKVRENTAGVLDSRRSTYAEEANLAVNQTVMRSISTSVISALPIISLMVVAVWMMGIGTLRDLALIQLIGVIEGIFSSLFLATPILVSLVNRQDKHKEHAAAVEAFRNGDADAEGLQPEAPREEAATRKRTVVAPQPTEPHAPATSSTWRPNAR